jgi:hypothetical protein
MHECHRMPHMSEGAREVRSGALGERRLRDRTSVRWRADLRARTGSIRAACPLRPQSLPVPLPNCVPSGPTNRLTLPEEVSNGRFRNETGQCGLALHGTAHCD